VLKQDPKLLDADGLWRTLLLGQLVLQYIAVSLGIHMDAYNDYQRKLTWLTAAADQLAATQAEAGGQVQASAAHAEACSEHTMDGDRCEASSKEPYHGVFIFYPSWIPRSAWIQLCGAELETVCQMVEEVQAIAAKYGLTSVCEARCGVLSEYLLLPCIVVHLLSISAAMRLVFKSCNAHKVVRQLHAAEYSLMIHTRGAFCFAGLNRQCCMRVHAKRHNFSRQPDSFVPDDAKTTCCGCWRLVPSQHLINTCQSQSAPTV
jgi:hypothetical protein